nr:MAG TPA_asm: hypothetical protein [Caudoviricetes sp.]
MVIRHHTCATPCVLLWPFFRVNNADRCLWNPGFPT